MDDYILTDVPVAEDELVGRLPVGSGDTYEGWRFADPPADIDDYVWPPTTVSKPLPSYPSQAIG